MFSKPEPAFNLFNVNNVPIILGKIKNTLSPFFIVGYKIILDKKIWTQGQIKMDVTSCKGKWKWLEIKTSHWLFSINLKKIRTQSIGCHVHCNPCRNHTLMGKTAKLSTIDQIIYSKGSRMTYKTECRMSFSKSSKKLVMLSFLNNAVYNILLFEGNPKG